MKELALARSLTVAALRPAAGAPCEQSRDRQGARRCPTLQLLFQGVFITAGSLFLSWPAMGATTNQASAAASPPPATQLLKVRLSWGHQSPSARPFWIKLATNELTLASQQAVNFESSDVFGGAQIQSQAGAGDVDGLDLTLACPERTVREITNLQQIWRYLFEHSDADTARRLRADPAYRPDPRKLTVQMNPEGTRGFSLTVDQLLTTRTFWVPDLDVFVSAGEPPVSFAGHQRELGSWRGKQILDELEREPEATYEQYTRRWEDMGSPAYRNPASAKPGHIVCVTWDSALPKFGLDRGAWVWNDYGNPDHFQFGLDWTDYTKDFGACWKGQRLDQGLPILQSVFEKDGVRYEIEQFAYPLHGPPTERRGDIAMVLLQKLRLTELTGQSRRCPVGFTCRRELADTQNDLTFHTEPGLLLWEATAAQNCLLSIQGNGITLQTNSLQGAKWKTNQFVLLAELPANGSRECVLKLPSPGVPAADRDRFVKFNYDSARADTVRFWSEYLARGAQFVVPDEAVNTLFRANLWHALRLPRRHGGAGAGVAIDLPYSNFAYDQRGTPWPVNQAIYVDYMLYDLRGYHEVSAEELAVMFRNNQEPNGHIKGYANWGVYTPSMIYAVAQNYLLSGNRPAFERLLPQTLHAMDWCLGEMEKASRNSGPASGLILAPLNDLSHENQAWAFNQAYFFAGLDLLARALQDLGHPRAPECRAAARAMFQAIERGFGHGATLSPLVQMRDHGWAPYVPGNALAPRRLFEVWYPTDIDSGPLHLSRLKALDPAGALTTWLLRDHEDNLFLHGWGMANEPVYNQHATAYLLRDEVKPAIRAFYSMLACAFSHSAFEPVEHRWSWGQYFGPPSTDGAWFDLYRHMLIHERDDHSLLLLQATPRKWLADGQRLRVERAPTYYGPLTLVVESRAAAGEIRATVDLAPRKRPESLLVRFRHPAARPMRAVSVNGQPWNDFDPKMEWVRLPAPAEARYAINVKYD
jgi:hypothetical protein